MHYQSLKKGDIILSVEQMRQLSLTGRASGKARAYAEGTIGSSIPLMNSYANSTVGGGSFQGGVATSSSTPSTKSLTQAVSNLGNTSTKSTKKVSSLSKALETLEKLFDWVEVKLERLQQSIDYSTAQSENAVGYKNKNSYLSTAQTTTSALISANNAGAKEYKAQADKVAKQVGLSTNLYNKIKNGTIDIQSLSENNKKRVEAVQEWYDKMLDCVQASEELKASQRELAQTKLDNITEEYDALITKIEHSANLINGFMEQAELKGYRESKNYYEALTKNATEQREILVEERTALLSSLQESLDKGDFDKNSIEFQNAMNDINGITESIQEADTNILKFANDMRQIEWDTFDSGQERISQLIDEADFLINLMSNDKLFDDKGIMTDQGNATMGLYAQDYNTYMSQADKYATEIERINEELNNSDNKFNQDLINRKQELIEKQRDSIKAAEDEKQAMIDLAEQGFQAQLDSLQELIDKYKDALKSQKDLNDYQKNVSDQAEEVSKLQKMVNVYSKIDTEEGRMKYQEYQNQLKEAQEELDQTEYDKYIADQESLLDDIYSQAEEFINEKLENTDALISELIATTNAKSNEIAETIATESEAVGYDLSNEMESIWGSGGTVTNVLSTYTGEFTDRMTTLQTAIDGILTAVQAEVNASDKQAGTDVVTSTTNNSENPQITGKTPTTTTSAATTTATQTKTEDTKKDDKIIKIIKKGNSDKAAIAKAKKNYHGTLWYYIVDNYGHIPTFAIYKELGKALGVKAPNGFNTLAEKNKLLKALKAKGYASGTDYVKKDQWANLNEEGQEIITLSDGSILTPVKQGSGIINNPNTEKLLALANDYDKMQQFMSSIGVMNASKQASAMTELERQIMNSQVVNNNAGGNYQITNEITFSLPNVSNYKEFVSQLQHDKQFENMVVDMTLGRANGGSKLSKYKYHW